MNSSKNERVITANYGERTLPAPYPSWWEEIPSHLPQVSCNLRTWETGLTQSIRVRTWNLKVCGRKGRLMVGEAVPLWNTREGQDPKTKATKTLKCNWKNYRMFTFLYPKRAPVLQWITSVRATKNRLPKETYLGNALEKTKTKYERSLTFLAPRGTVNIKHSHINKSLQ
jgi:hypothetical protein